MSFKDGHKRTYNLILYANFTFTDLYNQNDNKKSKLAVYLTFLFLSL